MRMGLVILLLTGMAVALVHIRRAEVSTRHEIQRLRMRQVALRRKLWDQQIHVSVLTSPQEVRKRVERMKLKLVRPGEQGEPMAGSERGER